MGGMSNLYVVEDTAFAFTCGELVWSLYMFSTLGKK